MRTRKPRTLLLGSGGPMPNDGGSGIQMLLHANLSDTTPRVFDAEIAGIASNHRRGGVWNHARKLGFESKFVHFPEPYTAEQYRSLVRETGAEFVVLSGWIKRVRGLSIDRVMNKHPGVLPGTAGLYGIAVHQRTLELFKTGLIKEGALNFHFADDDYDTGPIFKRFPYPILEDPDDPEAPKLLQRRVLGWEYAHEAIQASLFVNSLYLKGT